MDKIVYFSIVSSIDVGVQKKIEYQIKAFESLGYEVISLKMQKNDQGNESFLCNDKILLTNVIVCGKTFLRKIKKKIDWIKICKETIKELEQRKTKKIYIRYPGSDIIFLNFLKKLKKQNYDIYIEIPTYPYDNETTKYNLLKLIDKIYRKKLYKYVKKIITFSKDKKIWNIPCINISNGISLENIKAINRDKKKRDIIKFTSVSNCSFWHGIDRFLFSLIEYGQRNKNRKIEFNIIGEGFESDKLKKIINNNLFLKKIVKFQGFKSGRELEEIYNETDIGIGSLGIHRIGLEEVQPLKNREYAAKGLPFVIGFNDPDFEESKYVYKVANKEEIIEIENIIKWYLENNFKSVEIRKDAERFSWDIQLKKVIDNI